MKRATQDQRARIERDVERATIERWKAEEGSKFQKKGA
jgi:hypothetical protein